MARRPRRQAGIRTTRPAVWRSASSEAARIVVTATYPGPRAPASPSTDHLRNPCTSPSLAPGSAQRVERVAGTNGLAARNSEASALLV